MCLLRGGVRPPEPERACTPVLHSISSTVSYRRRTGVIQTLHELPPPFSDCAAAAAVPLSKQPQHHIHDWLVSFKPKRLTVVSIHSTLTSVLTHNVNLLLSVSSLLILFLIQ